ncbi:MAG: sporulation protein YunB [Oscillospiraceae bacterium]|nr:sporulation protein YunB [Oscillospiraceae bacterium]
MKRRLHRKRRLTLLVFALFLIGAALLVRLRMVPIVQELARARVTNEAAGAINAAVDRMMDENEINYDKIAFLEKDVQGNITAIKTNMSEVNLLRSDILSAIDDEISELSVSEIGVPLGSVLLPSLFAGKGPSIPVRIMAVTASDASFTSRFAAAGINQTLHRILLQVNVTMTVLTPLGTQRVTASSELIAAETVIVGMVPSTYLNREVQKENT